MVVDYLQAGVYLMHPFGFGSFCFVKNVIIMAELGNTSNEKPTLSTVVREVNYKISNIKSLSNLKGIADLEINVRAISKNKKNFTFSDFENHETECREHEVFQFDELSKTLRRGIWKDSSLDVTFTSSDSEKSSTDSSFKVKNKILCRAVKEQLKYLKHNNRISLKNIEKSSRDAEIYKEQLVEMKRSIHDLLEEATQTKEHLNTMRGHFESVVDTVRGEDMHAYPRDDPVEFDISTIKGSVCDSNMLDQVRHLKHKASQIQSQLLTRESEIQQKNEENGDLKMLVDRLSEIVTQQNIKLEKDENNAACTSCFIF